MDTLLIKRMTIGELKNAIWMYKSGIVPIGGLPLKNYEDELELRTDEKQGYHE